MSQFPRFEDHQIVTNDVITMKKLLNRLDRSDLQVLLLQFLGNQNKSGQSQREILLPTPRRSARTVAKATRRLGKGKGKEKETASHVGEGEEAAGHVEGNEEEAAHVDEVAGMTKKALLERLVQGPFSNGMTFLQLARIDLLYFREAKTKKWAAFDLSYEKKVPNINPLEFSHELSSFLANYFRHHIYVELRGPVMWIRVGFFDVVNKNIYSTIGNTFFLAYFTNSSHLLASVMRMSFKDYVKQGLAKAFQCSALVERDLTGTNLKALADLLLNQHSQGPFSQFRLDQVDAHPLDRKPKRQKRGDEEITSIPNVVREDEQEAKKAARTAHEQFGPNKQPEMNRVEFQVKTDLHSQQPSVKFTGPFPMKVVFEGPNVIEGIKSLISSGIAKAPLPPHLANLHSAAANSFVIDNNTPLG